MFLPFLPLGANPHQPTTTTTAHHVLLIGLFVPEHASGSPLSATKIGPFTFTTEATSEKFSLHRTAHARHTPLCDPLLGR